MRCGMVVVVAAVLVDDAGHRLQHRVHRRTGRHRPGLAEAGNRVVDDLRLARPDLLIAEAVALDGAGAEAFHEHVGAAQQAPQDLLQFRRLQVQCQAALAQRAVDREGGMILVAAAEDARPVAAVVWCFHLDDVGAVLREHHGTGRTGHAAGQVDHFEPRKGALMVHGVSIPWFVHRMLRPAAAGWLSPGWRSAASGASRAMVPDSARVRDNAMVRVSARGP